MAGFLIAAVAALLPLALGAFRLARPRVVAGIGGVVALGWLIALAVQAPAEAAVVPMWFLAGMVILLYTIWCGGLWLGLRLRQVRIQRSAPG